MISLPPWNRMPLTVHWFSDKVRFPIFLHIDSFQFSLLKIFFFKHHSNLEKCKVLPRHMNTSIGPFESIYVYRGGLYDPEDPVDNDSSGDDEPLPLEGDDDFGNCFYFILFIIILFYY